MPQPIYDAQGRIFSGETISEGSSRRRYDRLRELLAQAEQRLIAAEAETVETENIPKALSAAFQVRRARMARPWQIGELEQFGIPAGLGRRR